MLFVGMEMVHVLPRWPGLTMEVDIEGEVLVTAVEAMAEAATEVAEAMVVAPTPTGAAMVATEEATEGVQEETTEGPVEEATEGLGGSSEVVAEGAMGEEEALVATKLGRVGTCAETGKMHAACSHVVYLPSVSKPMFSPILWFIVV